MAVRAVWVEQPREQCDLWRHRHAVRVQPVEGSRRRAVISGAGEPWGGEWGGGEWSRGERSSGGWSSSSRSSSRSGGSSRRGRSVGSGAGLSPATTGGGGRGEGGVNGGGGVMRGAVVKWGWRCEGRSKCRKWQAQKSLESRIVWIEIHNLFHSEPTHIDPPCHR